MDKENKRLDRLDALLHALPFDTMPMAVSELDGGSIRRWYARHDGRVVTCKRRCQGECERSMT